MKYDLKIIECEKKNWKYPWVLLKTKKLKKWLHQWKWEIKWKIKWK